MACQIVDYLQLCVYGVYTYMVNTCSHVIYPFYLCIGYLLNSNCYPFKERLEKSEVTLRELRRRSGWHGAKFLSVFSKPEW